MGRGGKRPGAGRKADTPRVTVSMRVDTKTKDSLERLRKEGIPSGQLIDRLVADYIGKEG